MTGEKSEAATERRNKMISDVRKLIIDTRPRGSPTQGGDRHLHMLRSCAIFKSKCETTETERFSAPVANGKHSL